MTKRQEPSAAIEPGGFPPLGMRVQHDDLLETLWRARALGKRRMVGGPHASSQPELLLELADHVVVGEPDEVFASIAGDLERGTARPLYVVEDKPDISRTPVPRFDLLRLERYLMLSVQFSRGCPFQCEFCDVITIYGLHRLHAASDRGACRRYPATRWCTIAGRGRRAGAGRMIDPSDHLDRQERP